MDLEVRWIETTHEVYQAIYDQHREEFGVFASCTDMTGDTFGGGQKYILTEWGFKGAEFPILKSECHGKEWTYYIAAITEEV